MHVKTEHPQPSRWVEYVGQFYCYHIACLGIQNKIKYHNTTLISILHA